MKMQSLISGKNSLRFFFVILLVLLDFTSEARPSSTSALTISASILKKETRITNLLAHFMLKDTISENSQEEVFTKVEQSPSFPGGYEALHQFVAKNIRYPEASRKEKKEGNVIVQFQVTKTGKIKDPKFIKKLSPEMNAEALRLISIMPDWTPGKQNGRPVNVLMTLPIRFQL